MSETCTCTVDFKDSFAGRRRIPLSIAESGCQIDTHGSLVGFIEFVRCDKCKSTLSRSVKDEGVRKLEAAAERALFHMHCRGWADKDGHELCEVHDGLKEALKALRASEEAR